MVDRSLRRTASGEPTTTETRLGAPVELWSRAQCQLGSIAEVRGPIKDSPEYLVAQRTQLPLTTHTVTP